MDPFEPLVLIDIEPRRAADWDSLAHGMRTLMAADSTIRVHLDRTIGRATVLGRGELQLEIILHRLAREFSVAASVGKRRVAYKETLTRAADGDGRYTAQSGGRGQYGHVRIHLQPGRPGTGCVFTNTIVDDSIPAAFIQAIEEGITEARSRGVLSGYPIDDVRIELYDGSYHEVDSSATAFKQAAALAFQDAAKKASPVLLEPVVRVEVVAPTEFSECVADDLASRRGSRIQSQENRGGAALVVARIPFAELLGYGSDLRGQTQGRATYAIVLEQFEPIHHGPGDDGGDNSAPVRVPRMSGPNGRNSAVAIPEPYDEDAESAGAVSP